MEFEFLGWPDDDVRLELDHRQFSYAGKFVMTSTGKVVAREEGELVGALSFNEDRTDADAAWLRYLTVRRDRRGEGIGPELVAYTRERLEKQGYDPVYIAVNNPYAFEALARVGFGFTGRTTGLAELVLSTAEPPSKRWEEGLDILRERDDLAEEERAFIEERRSRGPPPRASP